MDFGKIISNSIKYPFRNIKKLPILIILFILISTIPIAWVSDNRYLLAFGLFSLFLLKLLEEDDNPWWLEYRQNLKGLKVLQVTDKKVLTWYNDGFGGNGAIKMGHWQHGVEDFLKKENIEVDFSKKGFCKN